MKFDQVHVLTLSGEEMRAIKAALLTLSPEWRPQNFTTTVINPGYSIGLPSQELARMLIGRILSDSST